MSKPPRSPLVGYNHNITHLGQVFHVQTEDSGPGTPRLFTHLFFQGTILASRKHEYDTVAPDDKVRKLMQELHKSMIRDLLQATFDDKLVAFFRGRGEELLAPAGALPSTPMAETPAPVVSAPSPFARTSSSASLGAPRSASAAPSDGSSGSPSLRPAGVESPAAAPSPVGPPRRNTRPIASMSSIDRAPSGSAGARSVDMYRTRPGRGSPSTPVARAGGANAKDGVLVERSVVIGGAAPGPQRPPRTRVASPYVVDGEGADAAAAAAAASDAIPTGLPEPSALAASPPVASVPTTTDNPSGRVASEAGVVATSHSGDSPRRDRNLDEAILEYLGDDSDS